MQWNADLKGGGVGEGNPQRDDAWGWHRVPDDLPFPCVVFVLMFARWGGWEERCWRAGNPVAGRGGWVRALPPPTPVSEVTFHTKGAACHPATATVTWATPPTSSWRQWGWSCCSWVDQWLGVKWGGQQVARQDKSGFTFCGECLLCCLLTHFQGKFKKTTSLSYVVSLWQVYKCDKARARSFKVSINSHQFDLRREDYRISK